MKSFGLLVLLVGVAVAAAQLASLGGADIGADTGADIDCGPHENFSQCYANPLCQPTCEKPDPVRFCTLICIRGCICKHGYVRTEPYGTCVPLKECKRLRPSNL